MKAERESLKVRNQNRRFWLAALLPSLFLFSGMYLMTTTNEKAAEFIFALSLFGVLSFISQVNDGKGNYLIPIWVQFLPAIISVLLIIELCI